MKKIFALLLAALFTAVAGQVAAAPKKATALHGVSAKAGAKVNKVHAAKGKKYKKVAAAKPAKYAKKTARHSRPAHRHS